MDDEINRELLSAVNYRELKTLKDLLHKYGLHKSEAGGYVLLRNSIINKHTEVTKLLLTSGSRVNSKRSKQIPSNTPLHFAVQNGDIEIIEMLLNHGADINAQNENCLTALIFALRSEFSHPLYADKSRDLAIVDLLLKHGANVNFKTNKGLTPLHFACKNGNVENIKLLLERNANVNARSNNGSGCDYMITPLYLAVQYSKRDAAKYLMDHGANIHVEYENEQTILNLAVINSCSAIVEDILKYYPDRNNMSNKEALKFAARNFVGSDLLIVQNLLNYGFSVEPNDESILLENAIKSGFIQIIQHLIKNGLDLGGSAHTNCIIFATKHRNVEIAKLLLTHGADVNAIDAAGKPAIYYSTENSDVIMTKLLISHGASLEKSPELLRVATKKVCKEIVEILLENKVDIEATDKHGRTALHLTALYEYGDYNKSLHYEFDIKNVERAEIARLFLSMGANVNAKTYKDGLTTLHIACQKGFINVVEVLLEYKADVNCVVNDCSPLLIAAQQCNASIMKMLIANGANVNTKRENGDTALHIVARTHNLDALQVLLENGADVYSKNCGGATPLHEATKQYNNEIVCILLQYRSPVDSKDIDGKTPLHMAVGATNKELVKILLTAGSDINILTNECYTAVDIAYHALAAKQTYNPYYYDSDEDCIDNNAGRYLDVADYEEIYEILEFHLIMLNTANLYLIEQNLYVIKQNFMNGCTDDPSILHTKKCEDEIKNLQLEKIANKISFYDILTKNIHLLASYARNEDIIRVFESGNYKTMFPIYAPIIERNFQRGTKRRLLLDRSQEFLKYYFKLPYDCSNHLLRYLSDADLENIINVTNTDKNL